MIFRGIFSYPKYRRSVIGEPMKYIISVILFSILYWLGGLKSFGQDFSTLISTPPTDPHPEIGLHIPEPTLADYREGSRAPGILVEPYDIEFVDSTSAQ